MEKRMSAPVLSAAVALPRAVARSGPATAGLSLDTGAAEHAGLPAVAEVGSEEKLPLWARMMVIFGGALACWAVIFAAVAAVTR